MKTRHISTCCHLDSRSEHHHRSSGVANAVMTLRATAEAVQALVMFGGQLQGRFSILPPSHRLRMHKLCRHVCGNKQPFSKPSLLVSQLSLVDNFESFKAVFVCRFILPKYRR